LDGDGYKEGVSGEGGKDSGGGRGDHDGQGEGGGGEMEDSGSLAGEGMEKALRGLERWVEDREAGVRTLIGGDFNARTGEEGGARR